MSIKLSKLVEKIKPSFTIVLNTKSLLVFEIALSLSISIHVLVSFCFLTNSSVLSTYAVSTSHLSLLRR